jgi:hypothetical protein
MAGMINSSTHATTGATLHAINDDDDDDDDNEGDDDDIPGPSRNSLLEHR